ncbi:MAG TPA: GspMb/PilO family protein [Pyrinomonadaceae bacterium]|nr:GspMb/PilO family protein [Pyrinomonadaceae bacterium]
MSISDEKFEGKPQQPEIVVNSEGGAVAIEEEKRMVFLTENETIIVEKSPEISVPTRPHRVYKGPWGRQELFIIAGCSLLVANALITFLGLTLPARQALDRSRQTSQRLESELKAARERYGDIQNSRQQADVLLSSVNDFESRYLPPSATGSAAFYQRLNYLIATYGLVNTNGPDYAPLDGTDNSSNENTASGRGRDKLRSLFPGIYVSLTVEGPYQNLRRFIRDLETGSDFLVISSVEMSPSETQQKPKQTSGQADQAANPIPMQPWQGYNPQMQPGASNQSQGQNEEKNAPRGRTYGTNLSLRLEMAVYFRRPGSVMPQ